MLVDSFASGVIGMLCVSNSNLASLRQLAEVSIANCSSFLLGENCKS